MKGLSFLFYGEESVDSDEVGPVGPRFIQVDCWMESATLHMRHFSHLMRQGDNAKEIPRTYQIARDTPKEQWPETQSYEVGGMSAVMKFNRATMPFEASIDTFRGFYIELSEKRRSLSSLVGLRKPNEALLDVRLGRSGKPVYMTQSNFGYWLVEEMDE